MVSYTVQGTDYYMLLAVDSNIYVHGNSYLPIIYNMQRLNSYHYITMVFRNIYLMSNIAYDFYRTLHFFQFLLIYKT